MPTPPSAPTRRRLTRDQRRDILLMRRLGYSYEFIAKFLEVTQRAVQYTCQNHSATPQHEKAGRSPSLTKEEGDSVETFVTASKRNRQITYLQVVEALWPDGEVGPESIKSALYRRGYRRRSALRKPPLSDANIQARLLWAIEHKDWTSEQWNLILWSD